MILLLLFLLKHFLKLLLLSSLPSGSFGLVDSVPLVSQLCLTRVMLKIVAAAMNLIGASLVWNGGVVLSEGLES